MKVPFVLLGIIFHWLSTINIASALFLRNMYTFGDSTVDIGTNNIITNPDAPKANMVPYGQSFFNWPTGRFSNGRLVGDFLAQDLLSSYSTPYLPSIGFLHGTNFASAGSGIFNSTNMDKGVIPLLSQVSQFKSAISSLRAIVGPTITAAILESSLFTFSTGSYDLLAYFDIPVTVPPVRVPDYTTQMVDILVDAIQTVIDIGARKIFVSGITNLACTPRLMAKLFASKGFTTTPPPGTLGTLPPCNEGGFAFVPQVFHSQLLPRLTDINSGGIATVLFGDNWSLLNELMYGAIPQGYTNINSACCGGGGLFNARGACGVDSYTVCLNPAKYIWWDDFHPTDRVNEYFAQQFYSGNSSVITPMNIKQLFLQT